MDVICDDKLEALIISGNPDRDELMLTWINICEQYTDALKDQDTVAHMKLNYELIMDKAKYFCIIELIATLQKYYADWLKKQLNELMRTNFKFDYTNKEEYDHEIKRAYNRSKGFLIDITLKEQKLAILEKKKEEAVNKKPTREYFEGALLTIRNHFKIQFGKEESTWAFCEQLRRMNQEIELLKNQKTNGGRSDRSVR